MNSNRMSDSDRITLGAIGLIGFLAVWQLVVSTSIVDRGLIGSPLGAIAVGARLLQRGTIWRDISVTFRSLGVGLVFALLIGAPLSIILGRWRLGWNAVELPLMILNATPTVALVIPIIMLVGIGPNAKSLLAFFGAVIPILVSGRAGAAAVPETYVRAAQVYGARRIDLFLKVVLPWSLLALLSGTRLGVGRALTVVLVGEMYATQHGLGLWISRGQNGMDADLLAFITLFVAAAGAALIGVVNLIDRSFAAWRAA